MNRLKDMHSRMHAISIVCALCVIQPACSHIHPPPPPALPVAAHTLAGGGMMAQSLPSSPLHSDSTCAIGIDIGTTSVKATMIIRVRSRHNPLSQSARHNRSNGFKSFTSLPSYLCAFVRLVHLRRAAPPVVKCAVTRWSTTPTVAAVACATAPRRSNTCRPFCTPSTR